MITFIFSVIGGIYYIYIVPVVLLIILLYYLFNKENSYIDELKETSLLFKIVAILLIMSFAFESIMHTSYGISSLILVTAIIVGLIFY